MVSPRRPPVSGIPLLTGGSFWATRPDRSRGLRAMVLSDGPAGVRGQTRLEMTSTIALPAPIAQGASWDPVLVQELGALLADQAHAKNVDVVLAPLLNLQRTPRSGRYFESFSEDPLLVSRLGCAVIRGLQNAGVGSCAKHYVGNDSETERMAVSIAMDETALREVYLAPFEAAVAQGVWLVMAAYSGVNGVSMSENDLLRNPLKDEWGFDGVVVSDWGGVRSTVESARGGMDLVMPGPSGPWTAGLPSAMADGLVPGTAIEDKVARIERLASRVGAIIPQAPTNSPATTAPATTAPAADRPTPAPANTGDADSPRARSLLRRAAAEGTVLLRNNGLLPLVKGVPEPGPGGNSLAEQSPQRARPENTPDAHPFLAILGQRAAHPRIHGGGSASVMPPDWNTPVRALAARFGTGNVEYAVGARSAGGLEPLTGRISSDPVTGAPGMRVRYLAADDVVRHEELCPYGSFVWLGEEMFADVVTIEVHAVINAGPEPLRLGAAGVGVIEIHIDDDLAVRERTSLPAAGDPVRAFLNPPEVSTMVNAGQPVDFRVRFSIGSGAFENAVTLMVGTEENHDDADLTRAVSLARRAHAAVIVVGAGVEGTEGIDRETLALTAQDDELIRHVAEVNPRTVVVLNTGAPVLMPWFDDVAAILVPFFGGQEMAEALADVLSGDAEPGGRTPCTWPRAENDVPVWQVEPVSGTLRYREGVHVGYREWLRRERLGGPRPLAPFGFGLGYTTWELLHADVLRNGGSPAVVVRLRNTGERRGKTVLQVYVGPEEPRSRRPVRRLAGFAVMRGNPGEEVHARIPLDPTALRRWSTEEHRWIPEEPLVIFAGFDVSTARPVGRYTPAHTIEMGALVRDGLTCAPTSHG